MSIFKKFIYFKNAMKNLADRHGLNNFEKGTDEYTTAYLNFLAD